MNSKGSRILFKRTTGDVTAEIKTGRNGQLVATTENQLLIPLAIVEAIITGILMALNYCLRFDPYIRYNADMVNLSRVLITCDQQRLQSDLSRPYYNYGYYKEKDMRSIELNYDLPEWVFFLCVLLIPISIICFVEGWRAWFPGRRYKDVVNFGYIIPQVARRIPRIIFGYITGGCVTGIFICILKFNIVSPRPHFMSVCFPSKLPNETTPHACEQGQLYWNPVENCDVPTDREGIAEALMSFPSYHAAISVFCGVYISAYLTWIAKVRSLKSAPLLLVLCMMVLALIGGTHRLATGHSFPSDIYIGAILGALSGLYVVRQTMLRFQERDWKVKTGKEEAFLTSQLQNKRKRLRDEISDDESSTDIDTYSDAGARFQKELSVYPLIPRATKPTQAINSNIGVVNNMATASPFPSNAGIPTDSPRWRSNTGPRTLTRNGQPWSISSQTDPHNAEKQRSSAPLSKQEAHHRSNSSFWGGDRKPTNQNPPPLSAFGTNYAYANPAMEAASKF